MKFIQNYIKDLKEKLVYLSAIIDGYREDAHSLFQKQNEIYVSFGENCLTDNLLKRYSLKSFTTPYSHGRSNIEYINAIEQDEFTNLLKKEYLSYCDFGEQKVVRNLYYSKQNNIYEDSVMNGFEFTHHDVINSNECRKQFYRRTKRLREIKDKDLYIFYHHRFCEQTNENELLSQLYNLYKRYAKYNQKVFVIMFSQKIVEKETERKVIYEFKNGVYVFWFYTLNIWGGSGDDFWAKNDDDLICKMMNFIKDKKLEKTYSESIKL